MTEATSRDPLLHRALGSPSRVRLLEVLREQDGPLDARELSERTALHANTVRSHLARLEEAGLVRSEAEQSGRRGRPRIVFSAAPAAPSEEEGYRVVADALADALLRRNAGGRAGGEGPRPPRRARLRAAARGRGGRPPDPHAPLSAAARGRPGHGRRLPRAPRPDRGRARRARRHGGGHRPRAVRRAVALRPLTAPKA